MGLPSILQRHSTIERRLPFHPFQMVWDDWGGFSSNLLNVLVDRDGEKREEHM
eukprot:m.146812 g.146812  ORF g.146812 m.146812 type:complete len:53 (-) comp30501_c0_seq1:407-565(-)